MRSILLWQPQVCGCIVHESIDDSGNKTYVTESDAEGVRQLRRGISPDLTSARSVPVASLCKTHVLLGHTSSMYAALLEDSLLLKRVVGIINARIANFEDDRLSWDLTVGRVLNISVANTNAITRTRLQGDADTVLGIGKVVFL